MSNITRFFIYYFSKFEAAMEAVMNCGKELRRNTPIKVGREYLNHLLFLQEYEEAGKLCSKILGKCFISNKISND